MEVYLTAAQVATVLSRLPELRTPFSLPDAPREDRLAAACELVEAYRALGLMERADEWVRRASSLYDEAVAPALQARYHLCGAQLALDRGDSRTAARHAERLGQTREGGTDDDCAYWAVQVRLALTTSGEPFSPLERAFRTLRKNPSSRWSALFFAWKAEWLVREDRLEEAQASLRRGLAEAAESQDRGLEVSLKLQAAELPGGAKSKALRLARDVLVEASAAGIPAGVARAQALVSQLTGGRKESESSLAFRAFFAAEREHRARLAQLDRDASNDDSLLLRAADEGGRQRSAKLLAAVVRQLTLPGELSRHLDAVYAPLRALMAADVFGIALYDEAHEALDYSLFIEEGRRTRVGVIPVSSVRSLGAWCFRERQVVCVNDIDAEYGTYLKELSRLSDHRPQSMLFQPLLAAGRCWGIVTVQSFFRHAYAPEASTLLAVVASCIALRLQSGARSEG